MCRRCGHGGSIQTGDFAVELVCEADGVGISDASTVLVEAHIANEITRTGVWSLHSRRVRSQWLEGLEAADGTPEFRQLVAEHPIAASPTSVEFEDCECHSVSRIFSNPLIVLPPDACGAGVWFLKENPPVVIMGNRLRELLLSYNPTLEFEQVYYEGEYTPPPFEGVRWDDLG